MRSDGAAQLFGSSCDAHRAAQPGDAPDRAPMWGVLADALSRDLPDQREALHLTFALADTERLEHLLRTAGFRDLRVKRETRQGTITSFDDSWAPIEAGTGQDAAGLSRASRIKSPGSTGGGAGTTGGIRVRRATSDERRDADRGWPGIAARGVTP